MILEQYEIVLYCSNAEDEACPGGWQDYTYSSFSKGPCLRLARADGWLVSTARQLCPQCSGKPARPAPTEGERDA